MSPEAIGVKCMPIIKFPGNNIVLELGKIVMPRSNQNKRTYLLIANQPEIRTPNTLLQNICAVKNVSLSEEPKGST
jgi:hypothetical protein